MNEMLNISDYAARRMLSYVNSTQSTRSLCRAPFRLFGDAVASDAKHILCLHGYGPRLNLPDCEEKIIEVLTSSLNPTVSVKVGRCDIHALANWCGDHDCEPDEDTGHPVDGEPRVAPIGNYWYDRNLIAKALHYLALFVSGEVQLCEHQAVKANNLHILSIVGAGWRLAIAESYAPQPGQQYADEKPFDLG